MVEGQGAWRILTEGTGYCCRYWVFEREQESVCVVGFFFCFGATSVFFAVGVFSIFLLTETGEGRSLVEIKERFPLSGVGAKRSIEVLVLLVCAILLCTGVCTSLCAGSLRALRVAIVGGEDVSVDATAGTSVARGRTKRTPHWIDQRRSETP